ncbi:TRAP transporter large permease [Cuneatibacter sp. NSJ-177]|uniref:TRAP transporter large permease n=1 Tax=Cuneatibacter sp. NSJ-177 TaxID=2931401 RepID=UPI001FCFB626|nr:TRAP transporter large permease [Cuneatibacter sp. NSJ-177]MCJ7834435.1 TRAP transporter large permease [Cuneatibacter sp. NSJ-177]
MTLSWYVIVSFIMLFVLLMIGLPVALVFFGTTLFLIVAGGYTIDYLFPYSYSMLNGVTFVAFTMFIIAGGVIERGGIGEHLINFVNMIFGRIKGGLGIVMTVTCAIFGAISGSAFAAETVIGSILLPRMKEAGYPEELSSSLLASCSMLGCFIPPSGTMLLYAWLTGQSVLACFLSTVVPGVILIVAFSAWMCYQCRNLPSIQLAPKLSAKKALGVSKKSFPALLFPIIVLGGIYSGIMTTSEAAAVSVLYALPVGIWVYRKLKIRDVGNVFAKTGISAGVCTLMVFTVSMLSRIYLVEDLSGVLIHLLNTLTSNRVVVILLVDLFMVFLGLLMDDCSAMLLCGPIMLKIVQSVGVDPIQFACMLAVNFGMGCVTPPCAPLLYMASRLGKVSVTKMMPSTFSIILIIWIPIILLVSFVPELSLWLPKLILGYGA